MYSLLGYLIIEPSGKEVGSSTMPHKVNPIDFENAEGNLRVADSCFTALEELQISRLQRDLRDSTMMRNIGVAFAHSMLAYHATLRGVERITPNTERMNQDLENHPEVLSEAIQLLLRKHGKADAYEALKALARGRSISLEDLHQFIEEQELSDDDKKRLMSLSPKDYVGLARKIVEWLAE